jgi:hypothetical protein
MDDALAGHRFKDVPYLKRLNLQLNVSAGFGQKDSLVTRIQPDASIRRDVLKYPAHFEIHSGLQIPT